MSVYDFFELRRASDGLIYQFDRKAQPNGNIGYRRRDQELWIVCLPDLGWVAFDEESESVTGRPWETLPENQDLDHPPAGIWVSRKGPKSYVYELIYGPPFQRDGEGVTP